MAIIKPVNWLCFVFFFLQFCGRSSLVTTDQLLTISTLLLSISGSEFWRFSQDSLLRPQLLDQRPPLFFRDQWIGPMGQLSSSHMISRLVADFVFTKTKICRQLVCQKICNFFYLLNISLCLEISKFSFKTLFSQSDTIKIVTAALLFHDHLCR